MSLNFVKLLSSQLDFQFISVLAHWSNDILLNCRSENNVKPFCFGCSIFHLPSFLKKLLFSVKKNPCCVYGWKGNFDLVSALSISYLWLLFFLAQIRRNVDFFKKHTNAWMTELIIKTKFCCFICQNIELIRPKRKV